MGLLFTKLVKMFMDEEHKVIVVGLDNAGKTTILYQFLMNEVVHTRFVKKKRAKFNILL